MVMFRGIPYSCCKSTYQRLFELHDRKYFHISGYSPTERSQDHLEDKIKSSFDVFRSVGSISDSEVSDLISKDAIDILVDLSGYTKHEDPASLRKDLRHYRLIISVIQVRLGQTHMII